jgi:hypothetical protein
MVEMRDIMCPQILLWTANFDEISARSAHPQISNQISRNPCLGQIRAAYLRTGVLSTVYTAPVCWHGPVQGGGGHMWTCAAQSCHGAVVIPAYLLHFLLYPLCLPPPDFFVFWPPFLSLDSFPPPKSKKSRPHLPLTSVSRLSDFFAFQPPSLSLDSVPPPKSKK